VKNKIKQKKGPSLLAQSARKAKSSNPIPSWVWPLLIVAITAFVFWPGGGNQLTTWDDDVYITNNKVIKSPLTWESINKIVAGNWQPGLVAQLWVEYHLFGLDKLNRTEVQSGNAGLATKMEPVYDATPYHIVCLMMHLLNGLLLFLFFSQFGKSFFSQQTLRPIALLATFIFYIHPMHVESVAWASETKDVGYAMWYHAALWVFCIYLDEKHYKYMLVTLLLFILSLLYKGQAVILPVTLALIAIVKTQYSGDIKSFDWQAAIPGWLKGLKKEEIAFFIVALAISAGGAKMAFYAQASMHFLEHAEIKNLPVFDRIVSVCFGLGNYLLKFIVPYGFSMFHSYPRTTNGLFDWHVYAIALLPFVVIALLIWFRRDLMVTFAILFFLVHILPVSQFVAVGSSVYWERYSYISYDGFCLLAAWLAVSYYPVYKMPVVGVLSVLLLYFGYTSYARVQVWHDTKTLCLDGLRLNPNNSLINACLGMALFRDGRVDEARKYLDASAAVSRSVPEVLATRAHIFVGNIRPDMSMAERLALLDSAINDCEISIANKNDSSNAYGGLGICYSMKGDMTGQKNMFDSARAYLLDALKFHGEDSADICLNIGHTFNNAGNFDSALHWYSRAISADSSLWPSYIHRGMIFYNKGKPYWAQAAADFKVAQMHDSNPANRELAKNYIQTISAAPAGH